MSEEPRKGLGRRRFLLGMLGGTAGLCIYAVARSAGLKDRETREPGDIEGALKPNVLITVTPDDRVLFACDKQEMGQGISTGLAMLVAEELEPQLRALCERLEWKPKELFMPVRVAVAGRKATPGLFETMAVLGKERCRRRLRAAWRWITPPAQGCLTRRRPGPRECAAVTWAPGPCAPLWRWQWHCRWRQAAAR